jgi:hypothetical protein
MNHVKRLLREVVTQSRKRLPNQVLLLVTTYSRNSDHDVDLFVILGGAGRKEHLNLKAYFEFVELIKSMERSWKKRLKLDVIDFPTMATEEYYMSLIDSQRGHERLRLHLLVYPTPEYFLAWEAPSLVASVMANGKLLLGSKKLLASLRLSVAKQPLVDRLQPMIAMLFDTYREIRPGRRLPRSSADVIARDGLRKLRYAARFILWELVRENCGHIPPTDFGTILAQARRLGVAEGLRYAVADLCAIDDDDMIGVGELARLFRIVMTQVSLVVRLVSTSADVHHDVPR